MTTIGEITILITDREKSACTVNELLTRYGDFIIARMGVPHREKNLYIISIVIEAPETEINTLTQKLGQLPKVKVKALTI